MLAIMEDEVMFAGTGHVDPFWFIVVGREVEVEGTRAPLPTLKRKLSPSHLSECLNCYR